MLILKNRIKESSLSIGYGDITLSGPFIGFQPFSAIGDGVSTYYTIENESRWEVGIGTYHSANNSLSRDLVLSSSNGGSLIDLIGVSVVFCSLPAEKHAIIDPSGYLTSNLNYSGVKFPDGTVQISAGLASGSNLSIFNNDINFSKSGDLISQFQNDAGYLTAAASEVDTLDSVLSRGNSTNRNIITSGNVTAGSGYFNRIIFSDGSYQNKAAASSGDNIGIFVNDVRYAKSGENITQFINNAGYLTSFSEVDTLDSVLSRNNTTNRNILSSGNIYGASGYFNRIIFGDGTFQNSAAVASGSNISIFVNDANYAKSGEGVAQFVNNAGYLTSFSESDTLDSVLSRGNFTNRNILSSGSIYGASGYFNRITFGDGTFQISAAAGSGSNISIFVNNVNYAKSGENISQFQNDAGYLTSFSEVDTLDSVLSRNNFSSRNILSSGSISGVSGVFNSIAINGQLISGITFNYKGNYVQSNSYIPNDVISFSGGLWRTEANTPSNSTPSGGSLYWTLLSTKEWSYINSVPLKLTSKLSSSPAITYTSGVITSIAYSDSSVKSLTWQSGLVVKVDHQFLNGSIYRKLINYDSSGNVINVSEFTV